MDDSNFEYPQPSILDIALINAAQDGDLEKCVQAIDQGARVDAVDLHYATPLTQACWSDSVDIVKMLLDRGADPNIPAGGKTPLMEAAYRGNREIIDLLIGADGDIFARAELAPGQFIDVPYMAQNKNRRLGVELRSLVNQQKQLGEKRRLTLKEVSDQLELDEDGRPKQA